jgi:hypothetical protein
MLNSYYLELQETTVGPERHDLLWIPIDSCFRARRITWTGAGEYIVRSQQLGALLCFHAGHEFGRISCWDRRL